MKQRAERTDGGHDRRGGGHAPEPVTAGPRAAQRQALRPGAASARRMGHQRASSVLAGSAAAGAPGTGARRTGGFRAPASTGGGGVLVQRCGCGGGCASCRAREEELVQRQPRDGAAPHRAALDARPRGGGQPLDSGTRSFMEPRFGRDFGGVRLHTGPDAAASARGVNARAFTVGQDIYFGAGEYSPRSAPGRRLLAHELTHTVQQSGGSPVPQRALRVSQPGDHLEREAERVASRVVDGAGSTGPITRVGGGVAQRLEFPSWEDVEDAAGAAYDSVVETAEDVGEAVVEGAEWVGEQAADAGNWLLSTAGAAAMAGVEALVGMFGGSITVTGTCIVVTIPSIPLFPSFQTTLGQTPEYPFYLPLLTGGTMIGPVPLAGTLGLLATIQGSIEAAVGPGEIRGINLTVCPLSGSATATGQLYAAAAIGPRLTMFGGVLGALGTILPFDPPIPVIIAAQAGLRGIVTGWGVGAIQNTVTLGYSISGGLTFNNTTELMAGVLLQGDLDAYAALRLYDRVICDYAYRLGHWETGAAYQLTIPINAGLSGAGGTGSVGPVTHGAMPIGDITTAIRPPPAGLVCLTWPQIKKYLCEIGVLPPEPCAPEAAPGPGVAPLAGPCPVPVNFRQTKGEARSEGRLYFEYAWDSSTGKLSDLSAVEVGEYVAYPNGDPYYWPSPPWKGSSKNPEVTFDVPG
ncbi:MAG TPA: DUF4157 domain-containing protein, partial [Longimicrobium sp.]